MYYRVTCYCGSLGVILSHDVDKTPQILALDAMTACVGMKPGKPLTYTVLYPV